MPLQALRDGTTDSVEVEGVVCHGRMAQFTIRSGPRVFHQSVKDALLLLVYRHRVGPADRAQIRFPAAMSGLYPTSANTHVRSTHANRCRSRSSGNVIVGILVLLVVFAFLLRLLYDFVVPRALPVYLAFILSALLFALASSQLFFRSVRGELGFKALAVPIEIPDSVRDQAAEHARQRHQSEGECHGWQTTLAQHQKQLSKFSHIPRTVSGKFDRRHRDSDAAEQCCEQVETAERSLRALRKAISDAETARQSVIEDWGLRLRLVAESRGAAPGVALGVVAGGVAVLVCDVLGYPLIGVSLLGTSIFIGAKVGAATACRRWEHHITTAMERLALESA